MRFSCYLSLDHLYQSLNQRIDQILQSLNNRALRLWANYNGEKQIHINRFFASSAFALNTCGKYRFHFQHFPNLRSIAYVDATRVQLQHLLQSIFCHEQINYLNSKSDNLSSFVQYIFSNGFPSLRSLNIYSEESSITSILTSSPNLTRPSLSIIQYIPPYIIIGSSSSQTSLHEY